MIELVSNNYEKEKESGVIQDADFSYDGYQVVRGEFFAHLFEPSVTLKAEKVSVNAACIRKLPEIEYVQFLVNPTEKKLAVKPCSEAAKDSFCWTTIGKDGKKKPKSISCKIFYAKVMKLMGWDPTYRYKILGKLIRTKEDLLFVFDLTCAETYKKSGGEENVKGSKPIYPYDWKEQFGVPVKEHQDITIVNIFDDYTVFTINKEEEKKEDETNNNTGYEEESPQNS